MKAVSFAQDAILKPNQCHLFPPSVMRKRSGRQHAARRQQVRQPARSRNISRKPMRVSPKSVGMDQVNVRRHRLPMQRPTVAKRAIFRRRALDQFDSCIKLD
jgi:hypothetical protein